MRIKGWMGRADQTTKIKGMFVRPEQIAEIGKPHPRTRSAASRRHTRRRERCDDAKGRMHLTERRLAGSFGGIALCRHQARRLGRIGTVRLAAKRRQGNCGRARLIQKLGFVLPRQHSRLTIHYRRSTCTVVGRGISSPRLDALPPVDEYGQPLSREDG
jgi:hypothetical protein